MNQKYKLVLDKGLFDSASSEVKNVEEFREKYIKNIQELLLPEGTLLMATCSYTEEEVKCYLKKGWWPILTLTENLRLIDDAFTGFKALAVLPTPVFEYKGKKGHNVSGGMRVTCINHSTTFIYLY